MEISTNSGSNTFFNQTENRDVKQEHFFPAADGSHGLLEQSGNGRSTNGIASSVPISSCSAKMMDPIYSILWRRKNCGKLISDNTTVIIHSKARRRVRQLICVLIIQVSANWVNYRNDRNSSLFLKKSKLIQIILVFLQP